jgi:hypothetical protein
MKRIGITLIELLLVIALIGVLAALIIPVVQAARESGRRTACANHMRQMALGLLQYESVHGVLPESKQSNYSFHVALLPHIEQDGLYREFDLSVNALDYIAASGPLVGERVACFECPSDRAHHFSSVTGKHVAATNYHGNSGTGAQRYGYNGLFAYVNDHPLGGERFVSLSAISDGSSQTAMLAEVVSPDGSHHPLRVCWRVSPMPGFDQFHQFAGACRTAPTNNLMFEPFGRGRSWIEGIIGGTLYNHVLSPNGPSCWNGGDLINSAFTSTSFHPSIANVAFADGTVRPISQDISPSAWREMGSRAGNP